MRKLPHTAAEDLLELVMRRYERASTVLTSNRPVDDWGKLLGDNAAVTALLDRLPCIMRTSSSAAREAGARKPKPTSRTLRPDHAIRSPHPTPVSPLRQRPVCSSRGRLLCLWKTGNGPGFPQAEPPSH
jgi:hypothetical protein